MRYWIFAQDRTDTKKPMECSLKYNLSDTVKQAESYGKFNWGGTASLITYLDLPKGGKVLERVIRGAKPIQCGEEYEGGWLVVVVQEE